MLRLTFSRFARPLTRIFDQFEKNFLVVAARVALKDSTSRFFSVDEILLTLMCFSKLRFIRLSYSSLI